MLIALRFFIVVLFFLLQSCQQNKTAEEPVDDKTNLTKAAAYNIQLGLGYLNKGDRPRAKKKLITALQQEPNSPDAYAAMAYYFEQTNEVDLAKKNYLKAISLSSNGGAQLNNYASFLCRQGEYNKAETYFLNAVKDVNYVNTSAAYENAGLCALAAPDEEKAKKYFKIALDQDPSRSESLYELVKLEAKQGHDDAGLILLQNHPDLVLKEKVFLTQAQELARKTGKIELASEYEKAYKSLEQHTDNIGVNNDDNSLNG